MANQPKTVTLIPSWKAAASIYIMVLESGKPEGKRAAKEGIIEMAEKFDAYIKQQSEA